MKENYCPVTSCADMAKKVRTRIRLLENTAKYRKMEGITAHKDPTTVNVRRKEAGFAGTVEQYAGKLVIDYREYILEEALRLRKRSDSSSVMGHHSAGNYCIRGQRINMKKIKSSAGSSSGIYVNQLLPISTFQAG